MSNKLQQRYRQLHMELWQIEEYLDAVAREILEIRGSSRYGNPMRIVPLTKQVNHQIEALRRAVAEELAALDVGAVEPDHVRPAAFRHRALPR